MLVPLSAGLALAAYLALHLQQLSLILKWMTGAP
jgi:hypothetical protein